ncbi:MAG: sigma-70 family RNA polymerase sigma factor [Deltaproteobacteria bacterium]|nr:sigma-70 family RNA polymerase sigma factor [Candidatus Zymogenaceae bacterium]
MNETNKNDFNALTDDELVKRAQENDYESFEELVRRYEKKIYGHAVRMLGNPEDAEDVLQETFLNAFRALESFRGESSFSTWIYRIATNNALMKIRKSGRGYTEFEDEIPPPEMMRDRPYSWFERNPREAFLEKELVDILNKAVNELPEKYRAIFLLRDVEGFSTQRASEVLGISESAAKSRLHRARMYLREYLEKTLDGEFKSKKG